ncbi:MAG: aspartate aminotransferase family protein [Saprospiraceae bacterium]|nr:aspartate aminotransferase family protein [Saprospiraceae bacterium]MDW8230093.1 aspartate aminotransferase family protein [Saprospiraceae bacterium]
MLSLRQLFLRHVAQTSTAPLGLEIERAEGVYLYDTGGRRYIDLIAGIGVSSLGHRHPKVEAAVRAQLERYWHTMVYGEYVLAPQVRLATLLAERLPGLDAVYFVNSGTEATEGAMKLAKRYTGRPEIVACRWAYHGSTQGAASLMWPTDFTLPYHPLLPGIRHISYNCHACLEQITTRTAAVIVETIQAESGLTLPDVSWLQALRRRCDAVGALLVLDEIQAGCGRTGTLFAFEHYGIRPDVLLLGKGFGGGMPIGAFIAPRQVMEVLSHDPPLGHITTFGGHPVSAAAALATMQVLIEGELMAQVSAKERLFREKLIHPRIREVRSAGLWLAVDLDNAALVQRVIAECLQRGVVTDWFLFNDRALRIAPPLIISPEEISTACQAIVNSLDAIAWF